MYNTGAMFVPKTVAYVDPSHTSGVRARVPKNNQDLTLSYFDTSDLGEEAIAALCHNTVGINAHKKQKLVGTSILMTLYSKFWGVPPSSGISATELKPVSSALPASRRTAKINSGRTNFH